MNLGNLVTVCDRNLWLRNYRDYPARDYPYSFEQTEPPMPCTARALPKRGLFSVTWGLCAYFGGARSLEFAGRDLGPHRWLANGETEVLKYCCKVPSISNPLPVQSP